MEKLIGREQEKSILHEAINSADAELVAVYGRRRVGKTFLIREVYKDRIIFELSGIHGAKFNDQLENFNLLLQILLKPALNSSKVILRICSRQYHFLQS